eukprot:gene413-698_t
MAGKKIRVGWIVGKDNDLVEDPGYVGDKSLYKWGYAFMAGGSGAQRICFCKPGCKAAPASALFGRLFFVAFTICVYCKDIPKQYRVSNDHGDYLYDPEEDPKNSFVHVDVAIPYYISKKYNDIEIDIILPEHISLERLKSNDVNFVIGYDVINCYFENEARIKLVNNAFKKCNNIWPTMEFQETIYMKSKYFRCCKKAGVPLAPTIFCKRGNRTAKKLLDEMVERGWKEFVIKLSYSCFSLGFLKKKVSACQKNPKILQKYFEENAESPEFVVQEAIKGFKKHWETRGFWGGDELQYTIANFAAVSSETGEEIITVDPPAEFRKAVEEIGKRAIDSLPVMRNKHGAVIKPVVTRTDIGCNSDKIFDKHTNWDPNEKTFFLNEIEQAGCNYFTRHLTFDCVPLWAEKYVQTARDIMYLKPTSESSAPRTALATKSKTRKKKRSVKRAKGRTKVAHSKKVSKVKKMKAIATK